MGVCVYKMQKYLKKIFTKKFFQIFFTFFNTHNLYTNIQKHISPVDNISHFFLSLK